MKYYFGNKYSQNVRLVFVQKRHKYIKTQKNVENSACSA